ncbi:hypothetical protein F8388_001688 [Cannabis sativa]|uniref:Uncharacterized protein n=1 Tax=Cannabis sativa TaxID=3483 RepID=A0A7J6HJZ9_CANSA|nr:hypothetical protein F8388_001688 [Cannabis sativa]
MSELYKRRRPVKNSEFSGEEVGSIKVLVKNCPRLLEINISDIKGYEKHVIYELIMEGVSHKNPSLPCKPLPDNCRVN